MLRYTTKALRVCDAPYALFVVKRAAASRRCVHRCSRGVVMAASAQPTFFLDEFAHKQFNDVDPCYSGTRVHFDPADFVARIQQYHQDGRELVTGYAPFCKHIFVPNFTDAKLGSLPITKENKHLLRSGYSRRRPEELPVLSRHASLLQCSIDHCCSVVLTDI